MSQLSGNKADEVLDQLNLMLKGITKLLKFVRSVSVPAVSKFVAAEAFGDDNPAGIKFHLGSNFKTNFLGKIEKNVPAGELNIHHPTKNSLDASIRAELGAEHEETTLAHFYELLTKQAHGESGALFVNGYTNISYIRDAKGNFWTVGAYRDGGDHAWGVGASSVEDSCGWSTGIQVVSCKSVQV